MLSFINKALKIEQSIHWRRLPKQSGSEGSVEMWKCGNVEVSHCLNLSNNSGSVEVWQCGNVEICLP